MENIQSSWNIAVTITLLGTSIIAALGYLIAKAIMNYNRESLQLRIQYENFKNMHDKMILESEIEIREQTFQYISKEIHDNIIQSLSLAQLTLNCINYPSKELEKQAVRCKEQLSKALADLNSLSKSLDSDIIESNGLLEAVKFEIERWQRLFENQITLDVNGDHKDLGHNKELFIFRIIQESLSNSLKHSKATKIEINVNYDHKGVSIEIKDNGTGFDMATVLQNKSAGKMAGLKNMKKRAELIGGNFTIETILKKGTSINVEIPI